MWEEKECYWVNIADQRTPEWHKARTYRLTASNFGTAAGLSSFKTPDELADEIAGLKKPEISERSRQIMDFGTEMEPIARNWYEREYKCKVYEIGLAVPKFDFRIGGSPDGIVEGTDGIIEIKCPQRMYKPLNEYMKLSADQKVGYNHIWPSHYAQMQGLMAILEKKWCDYVVYSVSDNQVFRQRIPFDEHYWEDTLYARLKIFLDEKLKSRCERQGVTVLKPTVNK